MAPAPVGHVRPALRGHFEFRPIGDFPAARRFLEPGIRIFFVGIVKALNRAEGNLIGCKCAREPKRECNLGKTVMLVPVRAKFEVYAIRMAIKNDVLLRTTTCQTAS